MYSSSSERKTKVSSGGDGQKITQFPDLHRRLEQVQRKKWVGWKCRERESSKSNKFLDGTICRREEENCSSGNKRITFARMELWDEAIIATIHRYTTPRLSWTFDAIALKFLYFYSNTVLFSLRYLYIKYITLLHGKYANTHKIFADIFEKHAMLDVIICNNEAEKYHIFCYCCDKL